MGVGSDDFLVSQNVDLQQQCTSISQLEWSFYILPIGASISLICYFYLLWMYFIVNSPLLKRHPTTLAIYKAIFSIIYVQQYLWLPFTSASTFYSSDTDDDKSSTYYCSSSSSAAFLSFVTQFSLVASQLCFLVISIDLRNAYTNPFSSYKQNRVYFAFIVVAFAFFTGFMLILMGPRVYGPSSQGTIWIQNRRDTNFIWPKFLLFYMIIAFVYCYSLWANFQYSYQAKDGSFSQSFKHRLSIMERSRKYTVGYILYESITFFCEAISFFDRNSRFFYSLPSYFYCLQGLWDLSVIFYSNWPEITLENINPIKQKKVHNLIAENVAQEGLLLQPHLNTSLRAEILYFTTQGIMFSALHIDGTMPLTENGSFPPFDDYERNLAAISYSFGEDNVDHERLATLRISRRSSTRSTKSSAANATPKSFASNSTISEIEKLSKAQDAAVTSISANALRNEYEKLGLPVGRNDPLGRVSVKARESSNSSLVANPLLTTPEKKDDSERAPQLKAENTVQKASLATPKNAQSNGDLESQSSRKPSMRIGMEAINSAINSATGAAKSLFSTAYDSFRFKDFCPTYFKEIRDMCGIGEEEYSKAFSATTRENFSEGRSGAFMFFSANEKYIVKTTFKTDMVSLYRILPQYVEYLRQNPNSLIVRFLGAHNITMYGVKLYFVVMLNVFPRDPLSERYDLKGSWVNRHGFKGKGKGQVSNMIRANKKQNSAPLYQDNDLQYKVSLQPNVIKPFSEQVKKDSEFLRDLNLMDYSLLIGVKRERFTVLGQSGSVTSNPSPENAAASNPTLTSFNASLGFSSGFQARIVEGPGMYYFGIIDILQEFNFSKRLERFLKIRLKLQDPNGISAMEPVAYAERFWKRCIVDTFEGMEEDDESRYSLSNSFIVQE